MQLRASELVALAPGSILRLPLAKHATAELRVGGLLLGSAHPVRTGEHRGAQLEVNSIPSEVSLNGDEEAKVVSVN
jgi:flagellar motor switch protein FliM